MEDVAQSEVMFTCVALSQVVSNQRAMLNAGDRLQFL